MADEPEVRTQELADARGEPCPERLPLGDDPSGEGIGVEDSADQVPNLLEPDEAWVCEYPLGVASKTDDGGEVVGWGLTEQPEPVDAAVLPELQQALDALAPADRDRVCTADLGGRWMVVYSHDGDLTGVLVDGFGCRDVRLTDDPHRTPPGAADQEGAVGGVLAGGPAILDALGVVR